MKRKKLIALWITLSLVFTCAGFGAAAEGESTEAQTESTTAQAPSETTGATTEVTTEATAETTESTTENTTVTGTTKKTTKKNTKKTTTTTAPTVNQDAISYYTDDHGVAKDPLTGETFGSDEVETLVNAIQGQVAEEAITAAGVSADKSMVYDIEITNEAGTELVALDGNSVTILLPFPESYDKGSLKVYYIDEAGQANNTAINVASNGVEFSVTEFGLYVLTWEDSGASDSQASTDMLPLVIGLLGILASVSAVVCLLLIRRRNLADEEDDDDSENDTDSESK